MTDSDPYTHSIYCGLATKRSLAWIANSLSKLGWETRMCSWTEHELTCDDADLVLVPHDPPLLSGGILPTENALDRVVHDLQAIGIGGDFELYDDANELLREGLIHNATSGQDTG